MLDSLVELLGLGTPAKSRRRSVILELEGRFHAAGSKEKKIARMYATTDARVVCVANYSQFKSRQMRGQVSKETTDGGKEILDVTKIAEWVGHWWC